MEIDQIRIIKPLMNKIYKGELSEQDLQNDAVVEELSNMLKDKLKHHSKEE